MTLKKKKVMQVHRLKVQYEIKQLFKTRTKQSKNYADCIPYSLYQLLKTNKFIQENQTFLTSTEGG